jgi:flagellar biosynthesis anti-sigma factor FlgM
MNIQSNFNSIPPLSQDISSARAGGSQGNTASAASVGAPTTILEQDQAHLSQAAVLASATSADSDVRLEKVAEIQQALSAGTYAVSPSDVAGKLIDHLLQK